MLWDSFGHEQLTQALEDIVRPKVSACTYGQTLPGVLSKLDLRDRTQAAAYAYQTGFVELEKEVHGLSEPIQLDQRRAQ